MSLELILTLHGIGTPDASTAPDEVPYWVSIEAFGRLLDRCRSATSEARWRTLITFDDGKASHAMVVLPSLLERQLTGMFFICAGRLGSAGYIDRAMLCDLASAGMEIGSHGMHHLDWRKLTPSQEISEYDDARKRLEDVTGRLVDRAAIPYGLYNRRVLSALRKRPYRHVYTCDRGLTSSQSWLKTRNTIESSTNNQELDRMFNGTTPWPLTLRRKVSTLLKCVR